MDKNALKESVYKDFAEGLTLEEVKIKYKEVDIPRVGSVISGCYSQWVSRQHSINKENTYKKQTVKKVDEVIGAFDTILELLDNDLDVDISAIDYLQEKMLHDLEKPMSEREMLEAVKKLSEIRKKRRSIKQLKSVKERLEHTISRVKNKDGLVFIKKEMVERRNNIDSLKGESISDSYGSKIKHISNKQIKGKIEAYEKEMGL